MKSTRLADSQSGHFPVADDHIVGITLNESKRVHAAEGGFDFVPFRFQDFFHQMENGFFVVHDQNP